METRTPVLPLRALIASLALAIAGCSAPPADNDSGPVDAMLAPDGDDAAPADVPAPMDARDAGNRADAAPDAGVDVDVDVIADATADAVPPDALLDASPDPCAAHADCLSCTSDLACGFCANLGLCQTGMQSGPNSGACGVADWVWLRSQCGGTDAGPADTGSGSTDAGSPDPCSAHADCASCTADFACGFCTNGAGCLTGGSAGPNNGACTTASWAWLGSQCGGTADAGGADTGSGSTDAGSTDAGPADTGPSCGTGTACGTQCVDLTSDPNHCGTCSTVCRAPSNGTVSCMDSRCVIACAAGYHVCGTSCASNTSVSTCGTSCTACVPPSGATATCDGTTCGFACQSGRRDCDGNAANGCEVSVNTDPLNCGACGDACSLPYATAGCSAGSCTVASCAAGHGNCDGMASNGCETDTTSDARNCGACGRACGAGTMCSAGACVPAACSSTRRDCDGNPANGCEVDTTADRFNCGACGAACPAGASCVAGACVPASCPPLRADCNGDPADGCETRSGLLAYYRMNEGDAVGTSWDYAGYAGNLNFRGLTSTLPSFSADVPPPTAGGYSLDTTASGFGGRTQKITWPSGSTYTLQAWVRTSNTGPGELIAFGQAYRLGINSGGILYASVWNNVPTEFLVQTSLTTTPTVADGRWHLIAATSDGTTLKIYRDGALATSRTFTNSGATPVRTEYLTVGNGFHGLIDEVKVYDYARTPAEIVSDALTFCRAPASTCGTCTPPAHAVSVCNGTACSFACVPGYGDCDGSAANGCEVDLTTTANNCGTCGNVCGGTGARCADGFCNACSCPAGRANCNNDCSDGCETDVADSITNCGACGNACSLANASAACNAGACAVRACNPGYGDCDGNAANGCETDTTRDALHCGVCGRSCGAGSLCAAGTCEPATCSATVQDCNRMSSDGCEADISVDPRNCGACGRTCSVLAHAQSTCASGGLCGFRCYPGFADCNGTVGDGCEADLNNDPAHCGSCSRACPGPNYACQAGACVAVACTGDYHVCNGACVGINDPNACGAGCVTCRSYPNAMTVCDGSYCGRICNAGYVDCNGLASDGCESLSEPLAYWGMDEGTGTTTMDLTRNRNDLVLRYGTFNASIPPTTSRGFSLSCGAGGTNRCADMMIPWRGRQPFTLQARVRATGVNGTAQLVEVYGNAKLSLRADGRVAGNAVSGTTNVMDGAWHLVAVTGDGSTERVYVDGFLDGVGGYTPPTFNFPTATVNVGNYYVGLIDEVKIYTYVRTAAEISDDSLTFCRAP